MSDSALSPASCPLCGAANGCTMAAAARAAEPCWCTTAVFSPELLARIPDQRRGLACVCAACVAALTPLAATAP